MTTEDKFIRSVLKVTMLTLSFVSGAAAGIAACKLASALENKSGLFKPLDDPQKGKMRVSSVYGISGKQHRAAMKSALNSVYEKSACEKFHDLIASKHSHEIADEGEAEADEYIERPRDIIPNFNEEIRVQHTHHLV